MMNIWPTIKNFWYIHYLTLCVSWLIVATIVTLIFKYIIHKNEKVETRPSINQPPRDISPGTLHYITNKGYHRNILTTDIIYMATQNLLTITATFYDAFSPTYTLTKTNKCLFNPAIRIPTELFESGIQTVFDTQVRQKEPHIATICREETLSYLQECRPYLRLNVTLWIAFASISMCLLLFLYLSVPEIEYACFAIASSLLLYFQYNTFKEYTPQGLKLIAHCKSFKEFLIHYDAEKEYTATDNKSSLLHTYQHYLPYVIAFDIEEIWADKFKPIFNRLEELNLLYKPSWYQDNLLERNSFEKTLLIGKRLQRQIDTIKNSQPSRDID